MAMTRQLWTLNGLAVELGKDRRTLGRALRGVPTDGATRGGYKGWFMETALHAVAGTDKARSEQSLTPPGFEVIDRVENPVDKAQLVLIMYLIYQIGPLAAAAAVMAGAPMKTAYAIRNFMTAALAMEAEKVCAGWEIGQFAFTEEPGIFNFDLFEEPDWKRLPNWPASRLPCRPGRLGLVNEAHHQLTRVSGSLKFRENRKSMASRGPPLLHHELLFRRHHGTSGALLSA